MDIIFTENRFFKEDILLTEDFLFARAIVCICCAGILIISLLGSYGARKETVWPLAVVRITIKANFIDDFSLSLYLYTHTQCIFFLLDKVSLVQYMLSQGGARISFLHYYTTLQELCLC